MPAEYARSAWGEIIAQAAVSPLGITALVILVVGFVMLALVRRDDKVGARLSIIILLLLFCGGLVTAAFYNVQPTITHPERTGAALPTPTVPTPSGSSPAAPSAPTAPARVDCGSAWSGWIDVGGAVGNPCPSECSRGDELGQSYRAVGFPPAPANAAQIPVLA